MLCEYFQIPTKQSFFYSLQVISGLWVDDAVRSDALLYFYIHIIKLGETHCTFRVPSPPHLGLRTRPSPLSTPSISTLIVLTNTLAPPKLL